VQPDEEQREICREILKFWQEGYGLKYNNDRAKAFEIVQLTQSLESAIEQIKKAEGISPQIILTSAKAGEKMISYADLREKIHIDGIYLILFGTGWGLSKEMIARADYYLPPIKGKGEYNHLAVRAAAAIVFDRLLGY